MDVHSPVARHRGTLLAEDEPRPWQTAYACSHSPFVILCDHAGMRVPRSLNGLGLHAEQLQRHIGWDIGAAALGLHLAENLQATLVMQPYSRLVIDCNRPPDSAESILSCSDEVPIPGNHQLSADDVALRVDEIFTPYHAQIRHILDRRLQRGQATVLLSLHSFTPVYQGVQRPWHIGLLYNRDERLARALETALQTEPGLQIGDNEPYSVGDDTDYSIPAYGERRGLPHVGIEIRQDLIADAAGQAQWASRLTRLLTPLRHSLTSI